MFLIGGFLVYIILNVLYKSKLNFLLTIFLGLLLASADEYHQSFSLGRTPQITDVGIDTLGIITGALIAWIFILVIKMIFIRKEDD